MKKLPRLLLLCCLSLLFLFSATATASAFFFSRAEAEEGDDGAPIAQNLTIETYAGVAYLGTLSAVDNEGDPFTFTLLDLPKKGTVSLEEDGVTFCYAPQEGKSGNDSFTYLATDVLGNVSAPATVEISIVKQQTTIHYVDLEYHPAATDAICLAENGIYTGEKVGSSYFFSPDEVVSRSEFLVMAMETAGLEADASITATGFQDDSTIDVWAKGYATAAVREGIVSGVATTEGIQFQGSSPITLPEAATILERLFPVTDVAVTDESLPTWAAQAVMNLSSVDVLSLTSEKGLTGQLTRGEAASMLSAVIRQQEQEKTSLLDLLFE